MMESSESKEALASQEIQLESSDAHSGGVMVRRCGERIAVVMGMFSIVSGRGTSDTALKFDQKSGMVSS